MSARLLLAITLAFSVSAAKAESWTVNDLRTSIYLNRGLTDDFGIKITQIGAKAQPIVHHELSVSTGNDMVFQSLPAKGLMAEIKGHEFERLLGTGIEHRGGFELRWAGGSVSLDGFVLTSGFAPRTFEIKTRSGELMFVADFAHFEVNDDSGHVQLFNLDLKIAKALALRLKHPELAGVPVGVLALDLAASVPVGHAKLGTPPACGDWSGEKDVRLIDIGQVSQWSRSGGKVAITPRAELKNVGTGNVPWQSKFSPPAPPYNTDQHPFLVWAMYRSANGVFEQLGLSDVKHAFVTTNSNCDPGACTLGSVLGLGCQDIYGTGTNQSTGSLSFRNEVSAGLGLWNHTGSHFDQFPAGNPDGVQDHNGGDAFPIHRMAITETDLQVPGAQYFIDSWYVVRDDIDIFNSMGWQRVTPTLTTAWTFGMASPFVNGSVLDAWVNSIAPARGTTSTQLNVAGGHLRLAAKTTDLGGGNTRYEYALMNHDFDRQVGSFFIPTDGVAVTDLYFHDADGLGPNDWLASQDTNGITWTRQGAQGLDWGTMFNFGFTSTRQPGHVNATLGAVEAGSPALVEAHALGPVATFAGDFE